MSQGREQVFSFVFFAKGATIHFHLEENITKKETNLNRLNHDMEPRITASISQLYLMYDMTGGACKLFQTVRFPPTEKVVAKCHTSWQFPENASRFACSGSFNRGSLHRARWFPVGGVPFYPLLEDSYVLSSHGRWLCTCALHGHSASCYMAVGPRSYR
jgi:hypothetical protein